MSRALLHPHPFLTKFEVDDGLVELLIFKVFKTTLVHICVRGSYLLVTSNKSIYFV